MLNLTDLQKTKQYDSLRELLSNNSMEDLINNIERYKLDKRSLKDLLNEAMKLNYGYSVINNIEKFDLNEDDRFELASELATSYGKGLIIGIKKFGLDNKEYKMSLARKLLKRNHGDSLIDNIENFKLDVYDLKKLLNEAIELNYGYSVIDNIKKFDLNEDDRFELAKALSENFSRKLIENIDAFEISLVENRFNLAKMMIKGNSYDIVVNMEKFDFGVDNVCKLLQEILLRGEEYLIFVDKLKYLFANSGGKSIIYVNKIFNLIVYKKRCACFGWNASFCRNLINFYCESFKFGDDVFDIENNNKMYCDKTLFSNTIKNLETLDKFCFSVNFDMSKILGNDNAIAVENELNKIKRDDVRNEVNNILESILFAYKNVYVENKYQYELTKLILEFIVIREPRLKERLLPLAIKYINDDNLKYLSSRINGNYKLFSVIFEILLDRFSLYNKGNESLLLNLKRKFQSSNFLRNSIEVQQVVDAFIELDKLNMKTDDCKTLLLFLSANIMDITRNMKYIINIIKLGYNKNLRLIKEDAPKDSLKRIYYEVYGVYLKMNYGENFINSYEKFVLREDNQKRRLEENIMTYLISICKRYELMEVTKKFLVTMHDVKKFRELRYDTSNSEHLKHIKQINGAVYEKWTSSVDEYKEEEARITDDPVDLFLIGTEIDGSCQNVSSNISYSKCLMAYVVDGKNKAVVVSHNNRIMARSIIRLLFLEDGEDEVVMFMEKVYKVNGVLDKYVDKLKQRCVEYAKWLNVSLLYEDKELTFNKECTIGLTSKSCMAPYEYFDVGGCMANDSGEQYFINRNLVYLYKKEI